MLQEPILPGLRERKKQSTRRRLSESALRLALAHGADRVTVDQICESVEVSPRTFRNYFHSKEEAFVGQLSSSIEALSWRLQDRPGDEPVLRTLQAIIGELDVVGDPQVGARYRRLLHDNPRLLPYYLAAFAAVEKDLAALVGRRLGVDPAVDPYPGVVVGAALTIVRVAVGSQGDDHGGRSGKDLVQEMFRRLESGFGAFGGLLMAPGYIHRIRDAAPPRCALMAIVAACAFMTGSTISHLTLRRTGCLTILLPIGTVLMTLSMVAGGRIAAPGSPWYPLVALSLFALGLGLSVGAWAHTLLLRRDAAFISGTRSSCC